MTTWKKRFPTWTPHSTVDFYLGGSIWKDHVRNEGSSSAITGWWNTEMSMLVNVYQQNKVHDCQTCRPVADGASHRTREKTYGTQGIRRKHEKKFTVSLKQMLGSKMF